MYIKCLLPAFLIFACTSLHAQIPEDALRMSWTTPSGSARNQAVGGALGSLGGDITANFVNPAGLGFYKTGELVLSPGFSLYNSKGSYRGDKSSADALDRFNIGTSGMVWGFNDRGSKWQNKAFSIAINRTANFNSTIHYKGTNNYSSFAEQFLDELANNRADTNQALTGFPFSSSLAYYTYLVDTLNTADGQFAGFKSLPNIATGLNQERTVVSRGGITEIAMGFAANMGDKLYLGGSLGVPIVNYKRTSTFTESDASGTPDNNFNYSEYTQNYSSRGVGVNLKAGLIYKLQESIRLGFALHTPTIYGLKETTTAAMTTDVENYGGSNEVISVTSGELNNNQAGIYKYDLVSPWKFMLSGAYVFGEVADVTKQKGFIAADVEYVTTRSSRFSSAETDNADTDYYDAVNDAIKESYKGALNARIGGELKFNTFMVRAGYSFYGNPYKNGPVKANRMNITGGLGYRNKGFFIDLAYVHQLTKDFDVPYRLAEKDNVYATVNGTASNILMTVGLKF